MHAWYRYERNLAYYASLLSALSLLLWNERYSRHSTRLYCELAYRAT
jgi:hypothetical protein